VISLPVDVSRGQALVEVLLATLLLVPLWLGVVYISRWHDLQHATIGAARYAAFESHASAGREGPARIEATLRRRLFSRDPARFSQSAPGPADVGVRPQWADHRGEPSLLDRDAGPRLQLAVAPQTAEVATAEPRLFGMLAPARFVGGPGFDLQRDAARRAPGPLPAPVGGLRLTLTERLSLLVDPWAARDPAQVAARIDSLSPAGRLREWVRPLEPVRWAVALFEPAFERLCLGRTDPEIVPPDRLVGGRGAALDLRSRRC
jgi:hypothetical protein